MEHFSIMVSFNQHQSNHISQSEQREISQSQSEPRVKSHKSLEARENASDHAAIFKFWIRLVSKAARVSWTNESLSEKSKTKVILDNFQL